MKPVILEWNGDVSTCGHYSIQTGAERDGHRRDRFCEIWYKPNGAKDREWKTIGFAANRSAAKKTANKHANNETQRNSATD